jgi:hypothetical protein
LLEHRGRVVAGGGGAERERAPCTQIGAGKGRLDHLLLDRRVGWWAGGPVAGSRPSALHSLPAADPMLRSPPRHSSSPYIASTRSHYHHHHHHHHHHHQGDQGLKQT